MVGIVVVAHGRVAEAMVNALEGILGPVEAVEAVTTSPWDRHEAIHARVRGAVERVGRDQGVVILTDMLGDTQTNVSMDVARSTGAEVVAGVNLPMLIKLASEREHASARELAPRLRRYGQERIFWASEPPPARRVRRAVQ